MKKITSLKIEKLFGTFDYEIDFESTDGFCILTAPNGFGKSTILKIIRAAAVGNICFFSNLVFESIEMVFKGTVGDEWRPRFGMGLEPLTEEEAAKPKETRLTIVKRSRAVELPDEMEGSEVIPDEQLAQPYVCSISCDDFEVSFTDEDMEHYMSEMMSTVPSLEPMVQYMSNNGASRLWKDKRDGEVFDISGVFRRYSLYFRRIVPWILTLTRRLNFSVNYISTNRLYNEDRSVGLVGRFRRRSLDDGQEGIHNSHLLKIFSISDDIRAAHTRCMRTQLQIARNLESNFVDRVMATLNQKKRPTAEETRKKITTKIKYILKQEKDCNDFGITSETNKMNKKLNIDDDSALIVFDMYLDDVKAKLDVFEPLIKKLKMYSDSLRQLMDLKEVSINLSDEREFVLEVRNSRTGVVIPLDALSSGEQHLIVLLGRLLFDVNNSDALVMMDEPEISFHPSWQEEFSEILFKIQNESRDPRSARGAKRQFIVATHSPAFIGDHWDKAIELAKMVR